MPRRRTLLLLTPATLGLAVAGLIGFRYWHAGLLARQEQRAFARAEALLQQGKPEDALALVQSFTQPALALAWPRVELQALTALRDIPRLALIYDRTPERILADEPASALLARACLHARKTNDFSRLRGVWRGRESRPEIWLALDCDALILAGQPRQAEQFLRSRTLPGTADATRLVRLALLTAPRDLPGAWELLAQAAQMQPRNPDIRSFRAQLLEAAGRPAEARVEYVAALVAEPRNPLLRDQLADFYQRQRNYDLALDTWTEALAQPTLDFVWLKAQFWSRVVRPIKFDASLPSVPNGELKPLAQQIAALPRGRFFDTNAFAQLSGAHLYAAQRQEVFWLRLLDALQSGREAEAFQLLKFEPKFKQSWEPDLAAALYRTLYYRQKRSLNPPDFVFASQVPAAARHQFFVQLEDAAFRERTSANHPASLPVELDALLRGPNAFAAAALAAGWREAALQLGTTNADFAHQPEWLVYGLAQVLRINRSPQAAREFLARQRSAPALDLLRAELLIEAGQRAEALKRLAPLATLNSGEGFRAAYLLALDAAENRRFDAARRYVEQQPLLAADNAGKELCARLALAEGKTAEAEQIYRAIAATSVEAKTWFARRAFAQKQWKEAREWTFELLKLIPDSPQLRENLLAIDRAEAAP
jgi:hypothetical protein